MNKTLYAVSLDDLKKETIKHLQTGWEAIGLPYDGVFKGYYQKLVKKAE